MAGATAEAHWVVGKSSHSSFVSKAANIKNYCYTAHRFVLSLFVCLFEKPRLYTAIHFHVHTLHHRHHRLGHHQGGAE
jgi:hypothetical protein